MAIRRIAILLLLLPTAASFAQRQRVEFNPQTVEAAIQKAADALWKLQQTDGSWGTSDTYYGTEIPGARSVTAVYALLAKGESVKDERMQRALDWLIKLDTKWTYIIAFRCQALALAAKQDKKYLKPLEKDVFRLVKEMEASPEGGYHYRIEEKDRESDNSNAQYAILGVYWGARLGLEIPKSYWEKAAKYWLKGQKADGGWSYLADQTNGVWNESYSSGINGSMSAAGLASVFICVDAIYADKFLKCSTNNEFAPIKKGLDWFDKHFMDVLTGKQRTISWPYFIYGVERIGLASGYKYFGAVDWYKEIGGRLLEKQRPDGTWGEYNESVGTMYALLFLVRGQKPMLFNRLEYDGDWTNRPRALANFCRWGEAVYETEVNWQIITLKSAVEEWHDAPIVVITGSKAPKFSDQDIDKLRTYVNQGGMIFGITECGSGASEFGKGIRELYRKLFPKYELSACGKDHVLNTIQYKLTPNIKMFEVHNGIRPLIIHTDADLPLAWQQYQVATGKPSFEAAANATMYVTDRQLRNRGATVWPMDPAKAAGKTVKAARIRYAGNYDPEPLALQRLSRLMRKLYDTRLDYESALSSASAPASGPATGMPLTGLSATELTNDIKLALMTGTGAFSLSKDEKAALKNWVEAGGLLAMDAGGGAKGFADSARDLIAELWGADSLLPLPLPSPVYLMKDMTIEKVKYRRPTRTRIGPMREPRLMAVLNGDRPKVIFSAEDLTGGLVGFASYACDGYEPENAFDLARNIILYAASAPPPANPAPASSPGEAK
ncbi:MAG: DUF4159 domain-containing protein [Planctomycetes bacterium]|nr:DUF4159 domain-containing protein [Planctomycetota bacterium]